MTREQALKQAVKRWGKRAYIKANESISSPERREAAQIRQTKRREERATIEAEIKRREEMAGIPALRDQIKELSSQMRAEIWDASYRKFEIGFVDSIIGAFNVKAAGDTWEEAFAEFDARSAKAS